MPVRRNQSFAPVADLEVDASRSFPVKVNYSNLNAVRFHREYSIPVYLHDLQALRARQPYEKGVYTTHGLNQANLTQNGEGFVGDAIKYGRRKAGDAVEWVGNAGVDFASNYAKGHVKGAAKRVRGDGFFRNLAGNAIKTVGNILGDTVKGGAVRRKRKTAKGGQLPITAVHRPRLTRLKPVIQGDGFFRNLAGNAIKTVGNIVGNTVKGDGIYAPGMRF